MENLLINGLSGCFSGSEIIPFTGENVSDGKTGSDEFLNVLKDIIGKDFTANMQMQTGIPLNVDNGVSLAISAMQAAPAFQLPGEAGGGVLLQQNNALSDISTILMSILSAYGLNTVSEAMPCVPESGIETPKAVSTDAMRGDKEDAPYKEAIAILCNELCKIFNLFKPEELDIALTPQNYMSPEKSISYIVGVLPRR